MLVKIENIDSKEIFALDIDRSSIQSKLGFLIHKAMKIPLYLVNKKTMDTIYPPEKRMHIDEEMARDFLKEFRYDFERQTDENVFRKLFRENLNSSYFIAVGVYCHSYSNLVSANKKITYPCIFICPERVIEIADEVKARAKTIFEKVFFHELAHSYIHIDFRKYGLNACRIIEESYCNAVALSRFKNESEISDCVSVISHQPPEYRGYSFFNFFNNIPFSKTDPIFFEEFFHFYRHFVHDVMIRTKHYDDFMFCNNFLPFFCNDIRSFKNCIWDNKKIDDGYLNLIALLILKEVLG